MSIQYVSQTHLDASAAIKLVLDEPGSDHVRKYFTDRGGFYITGLCLAEALGVLKRKKLRGGLSGHQYFGKCYLLLAYLREHRINLDDIQISSVETFLKAEDIARRHNLDLSDSLQIVSVKYGRFCSFVQESKTVLATADRDLESAARMEGLRVWNCEDSEEPPPQ